MTVFDLTKEEFLLVCRAYDFLRREGRFENINDTPKYLISYSVPIKSFFTDVDIALLSDSLVYKRPFLDTQYMDEKHFDIYEEQSTILLEKLERLDNSDFPADILKEKISEFLNPSYSFMSEEKRLELLNIYQ